jgi:maltooligosyltrehalose trehalohydrolase
VSKVEYCEYKQICRYINNRPEMNYTYPAMGARCEDGRCTFTVWAPLRKQVALQLQGKSTTIHSLVPDDRGFWSITLDSFRNGDRYLFRLDDQALFPDPASRSQPEGVHGPSAIADSAYPWTDDKWKGLPLEDMILYELHTGTFTPAGTFEGVISKLDHLVKTGINTIEIMPVAQFPGTRNWGYDGVYPFAVQHSYGGVAGLKRLVNEAHTRGLAVILDVVYNHQGPEGNYFPEYGPFFTDKVKTFWGDAINYDGAYADGVRQFYFQNALQWLDEFHLDGLRLDAVHAIWDFSARHFFEELREKVTALEERTGRKKVLIAELDLNNPRYINPPSVGGYGLDGQWIDEFHHALHALVTGEMNGYYEDFGETAHLAKSLKDSYVYTGQYSVHRKKSFGVTPERNPYGQFVVFAQNHDQIGNRLLGDRLAEKLSLEALKLTAATVLLSPHVPMLFMGEEYGETRPFQYFISHTDAELVENVRKGRRQEFKYFNWEGEIPDPQSEEVFRQCVLSWEENATLSFFYQYLISFRKSREAMKGRTRDTVTVFDPAEDKVIAFERKHNADHLLIVLNFNKAVSVFTPQISGSLWKIFDSSSETWDGPGEITAQGSGVHEPVRINPESAVIFEIR